VTQVAELFEQQLGALRELEGLLALETSALANAQDETIVQLAGEKQGMLCRLQASAQGLEALLRDEGFAPNKDGLNAYIQQTDQSGELGAMHHRVMGLLRTCRAHNQTNGVVLQRRRSATERALRVLFQHQCTSDRYSPAGKLDGPGHYRSIGEA
jgi:flagellar biosynthesis/type III secretory pathway chaperone